jgi:hypothetical protein
MKMKPFNNLIITKAKLDQTKHAYGLLVNIQQPNANKIQQNSGGLSLEYIQRGRNNIISIINLKTGELYFVQCFNYKITPYIVCKSLIQNINISQIYNTNRVPGSLVDYNNKIIIHTLYGGPFVSKKYINTIEYLNIQGSHYKRSDYLIEYIHYYNRFINNCYINKFNSITLILLWNKFVLVELKNSLLFSQKSQSEAEVISGLSELNNTTNSQSIRIDYDKFNDYIKDLDIYI